MLAYLSRDWLAALQDAADGDPGLRDAISNVSLSVEQHVTSGPQGDVTFHVVLDRGTVRVGHGSLDDPDVSITQPYRLAAQIAQGRASAQAAAMVGEVAVTGRIDRLAEHAGSLERLDDVFGAVRARTEF